MSKSKTYRICGDDLTVNYDGNVWQAPATGRRFASAERAMQDEVAEYLTSCGEHTDAEDVDLDDVAIGRWVD